MLSSMSLVASDCVKWHGLVQSICHFTPIALIIQDMATEFQIAIRECWMPSWMPVRDNVILKTKEVYAPDS